MKRSILTLAGLLVLTWIVLVVPLTTSYFCDLSNQYGGSAFNQSACVLYRSADIVRLYAALLLVAVFMIVMVWMRWSNRTHAWK
jgi:type II secretory pathway component PulF